MWFGVTILQYYIYMYNAKPPKQKISSLGNSIAADSVGKHEKSPSHFTLNNPAGKKVYFLFDSVKC